MCVSPEQEPPLGLPHTGSPRHGGALLNSAPLVGAGLGLLLRAGVQPVQAVGSQAPPGLPLCRCSVARAVVRLGDGEFSELTWEAPRAAGAAGAPWTSGSRLWLLAWDRACTLLPAPGLGCCLRLRRGGGLRAAVSCACLITDGSLPRLHVYCVSDLGSWSPLVRGPVPGTELEDTLREAQCPWELGLPPSLPSQPVGSGALLPIPAFLGGQGSWRP